MRFLLILFSILLYGFNAFCQEELLSGLYFSSHEVIQDKRTSLNLTPNGSFKLPDRFCLEMEANFRRGDGHYGYIFRIIGNGGTNIDLVSNLAPSSSNIWLVLKDKVLFSFKLNDIPNGEFNSWIKISVDIDIRNSKLSVSLNGNKKEANTPDIKGLDNFELIFGACRNTSFFNTDVSPMSLKNIRIFNSNDKLIREWKLKKHNETKVYDEIRHEEALVENPIWSIDKHVKWHKLKDIKIDSLLGITKDEKNGRVIFVDNRAVYILSIQSSVIDTIPFEGGLPYFALGNQIIYNNFTNELWSYDFYKNEISKFSFISKKWSCKVSPTQEPDLWHHNKFISPIDSSLVTLFGYGHYTYKSIINRYDLKLQEWKKIDIKEQIQPRYLSSTGFLNNGEMLIFGGYGSHTGRQELSPEFYYDLYKLNLYDYSLKKLWTLDPPAKPFVPCEALIPDPQSNSFFTLVYNRGNYTTYFHLAKFGIENNEYHLYNDSIPYNFLDTESWSTLFLDQISSQLIAVISHKSDVSIYSIAYPPLMPEDISQTITKKFKWYIWLIGSLFFTGLIFITLFLIRNNKRKTRNEGLYQIISHPNILSIAPIERKTISSILLMGGFQVYNQEGRNITAAFSPTLKQLFVFILLNTIKNGKGISSTKLDEVLWYDKLGESARNNRNVNISKLRSIIDEVDGVEVINENSIWKIKMEYPVYCDYVDILKLLRKLKSTHLTESEIHELLALLSTGEFLPLIENEWMDEYKSQFTSEMIEGLSSLFNIDEVMNNLSLRYHIAECVLVYDRLNEEAFAMKYSILHHLGKKGMAKKFYDSFCQEYKQVLGIDYSTTFDSTIK